MLNIIIGPMKSSKSKFLIELYNTLNKNETIIFISNKSRVDSDNKYYIKSRNNIVEKLNAINIENLNEINNYLNKNHKNILIDEFQFFTDIDVIIELNKKGYLITIAGLIQSYNQTSFGLIKNLIHLADDIYYLKSICEVCSNNAINNIKKNVNIDDINSESISICSKCLYK